MYKKKIIQQIYLLIKELSCESSIIQLCKLYSVSRSGYYKWLNRYIKPNCYEDKQILLDYYVKDIHAHYPSMGYRTIKDTLFIQTGLKVCDLSVWRSMRRLGIRGYTRRTKHSYNKGNENPIHKNILNRNFYADKPLQKIVTDISYISYRGKWFYLSCFLDLFNNEVIEWQLSEQLDIFLVINPAKRLLEKTKCTETPILLHSDQGVQYTSTGYQALLKQYNVIQSMSRAGTPRDNAVIESFFGRFKDVLRFQFKYWKQDDLFQVVSDVIDYFNCVRPVRKLNGKPPVPFRIEQVA